MQVSTYKYVSEASETLTNDGIDLHHSLNVTEVLFGSSHGHIHFVNSHVLVPLEVRLRARAKCMPCMYAPPPGISVRPLAGSCRESGSVGSAVPGIVAGAAGRRRWSLQVMELYKGRDGFLFFEVMARQFDDAYFESSTVHYHPPGSLSDVSKDPDSAAIAFARAFWAKPPITAKETRVTLLDSVMWYSQTAHSDAVAVIAEAEKELAAGVQIWAYGSHSNPNGSFAESSVSGELTAAAPHEVGGSWAEVLAEADEEAIAAEAGADGAAVGGDVDGGGGGGVSPAMIAGALAGVGVLLLAIIGGCFVYRRRGIKRGQPNMIEAPRGGQAVRAVGEKPWGPSDSDANSSVAELGSGKAKDRDRRDSSVSITRDPNAGVSGVTVEMAKESGHSMPETLGAESAAGQHSPTAHHRSPSQDSWRKSALYDVPSGGRSSTESGGTSPGFVTVGSTRGGSLVRGRVAAAVQEMQGALQAELQEDQLKLYGVIGRGGFGTVYHGARFVRGNSMPWMTVVFSYMCRKEWSSGLSSGRPGKVTTNLPGRPAPKTSRKNGFL